MTDPRPLPPVVHAGVRVDEVWIPMPDGVRLAANVFRPAATTGGGAGERLPVLLEYLPYRKDDGMYERDWDLYAPMVAAGYACVKVEIRGTGRSEGSPPPHEYSEVEHRDGDEVIRWLASQPWSNGSIGMWGISWGGFNAIQMAMRPKTPSALKAILAVDATELLFHEDVHYIDGMFHVDEYDVMIDLDMARAGAPDFPLDEATLAARFDAPPWKLLWLRHQRDDAFWQRASLGSGSRGGGGGANGYERLRLPTYLIGGWFDGYRDSVLRMLERCPQVPVRALMGPWNHAWPHDSTYGPEHEWRVDAIRWWDRWLKGDENGIEHEPKLRVFVQRSYPPDPAIAEIPGAWREEDGWPIPGRRHAVLCPGADGTLGPPPGHAGAREIRYLPSGGAPSGLWWGEVWPDQRALDANALVFETSPLTESLEVVGLPVVEFSFEVDAPLVNWFARLSDVAPDGSVTLVTGGGARSATIGRRESSPGLLDAGQRHRAHLELHTTGWEFEPGHRIRLSLSNAMWPMIWPTPYACTSKVFVGEGDPALLTLPVVPPASRPAPGFPGPAATVVPPGWESDGEMQLTETTFVRDEASGVATASWEGASGHRTPWGSARYEESLRWTVEEARPANATCHGESVTTVHQAEQGRELVWRGILDIESDETTFHYRYARTLDVNGARLREREWREDVPRDHQ